MLCVGLLLGAAACGTNDIAAPPEPDVDLDILAARIAGAMDTTNSSYSYVIARDGTLRRSGASGFARRPADGNLAQGIDRRMIVFSLSKLLTTVAALQLIEARGLTIDSTIGPWLPAGWNAPAAVNALRFRDLLSHRSGLRSSQSAPEETQSWNGMRDSVANGTPLPPSYTYQNLNFALFQVIIPALWAGQPGGPSAGITLTEASASFWYRYYVLTRLLEPAGIADVDCIYEDRATATRLYGVGVADGLDPDDRTLWCASGGWYLSSAEYARFMAYLRHTSTLLSPAQRQLMDQAHLGWDGASPGSTSHGTYYTKNGSRSAASGTVGGLTQVSVFPATGVEVVLFTNTRAPNESSLNAMIRNAYEAAIID
jgi:CubicO group peptidase (beta-lactamase class C family)